MTYFPSYGESPGCEWRKINGRWVQWIQVDQGDSTFTLSETSSQSQQQQQLLKSRQRESSVRKQQKTLENLERQDNRCCQEWQPVLRNVQGTGTLRRINHGLSEGIKMLQLDTYAFQHSGFQYCAEFYSWLLEKSLPKISGTTQRHIFSMIEQMVATAVSTEFHVPVIKKLLQVAASAVESGQQSRIGSHSLWKRHRETVHNCIIRVSNFEFRKREDDGKPCLMDLPKETLLKIVSHLSNPADIVHLGQTCSYLNDISKDIFLWKKLAFFHFTDKQLLPFIDQEIFCDLEWRNVFERCFRKHKKLKKLYGDELELCNNCRCLHWRVPGHPCNTVTQAPPSSTSISPYELMELFHL